MGKWFEIPLWKRILVAMVLGIIVGFVWGDGVSAIAWIGQLFIRLIRMVVVPLVFVTLVSGVISMGDPNPSQRLRIFWGVAIGSVAAALLFSGGLAALQTASILAALPFSIVVILASFSLCSGLYKEVKERG